MSWADGVRVRSVWVRRRGSRLLVPFDPPELSIDAAIDRGWELGGESWLMLPVLEEFLPAYPLTFPAPVPGQEWFPHDPRPLIVRLEIDPNYL